MPPAHWTGSVVEHEVAADATGTTFSPLFELWLCVTAIDTRSRKGDTLWQRKSVFIAFSMDDEAIRNLFTGQRVNSDTPFEFIDLSVKERYESDWKDKVTTRIRRSDGVIALISSSTSTSEGELWEISAAVAEGKPLLGIWIEEGFREKPAEMGSAPCVAWTWDNVAAFIESL